MNWKGSAVLILLLVAGQGIATTTAQTTGTPPASRQIVPKTPPPVASSSSHPAAPGLPELGSAGAKNNCEGGGCDEQPSHITISTPAPAPAPWLWQDRVAWAANLVLVVLGYVAIMLALSILKKIERQTRYAETAAQATAESAQSALLHAQAMMRAERPWILISVEPTRGVENGFTVTAMNRGRGPARIVSTLDRITTAVDQNHLPETPQYDDGPTNTELASVILLPGESTGIKTFSRDEVKGFCGSEEKLRRVEKWEELILLYGKITYQDLVPLGDVETHESSWCCWYIHGRQKSGMVMAGPAAYNAHT